MIAFALLWFVVVRLARQFYLLCGLEVADDKAAVLLVFLPIRRHVSRWNDLRESKLKPIFLNSNVKQPVKLNLGQC